MKKIEAKFEVLNEYEFPHINKAIERVGRVCYKSEDRIGEGTADKFVAMLIGRQHEAMIEHAPSISVLFTVDRGVTHEEVRHRMASFAQESTRYCNYSKDKFGSEITVVDIEKGIALDNSMKDLSPEIISAIIYEWSKAMMDAETHYFKMLELGASPQIARSVLPNSTKSDIVITANVREWRKTFSLRTPISAHPQMREVMIPLLEYLKTKVNVVFDDLKY